MLGREQTQKEGQAHYLLFIYFFPCSTPYSEYFAAKKLKPNHKL
jgi:hypothetical protein